MATHQSGDSIPHWGRGVYSEDKLSQSLKGVDRWLFVDSMVEEMEESL